MKFKDAAFMGIMRWSFYEELKNRYKNVHMTYGYITKNTRIKNNLPKEHYVDARCISGNPSAKPLGIYYYQKKVRCHNRQIHKATIYKGGKKRRAQMEYIVKGFRLYDKVSYQGKEYFVMGRRTSGSFAVRTLKNEKSNKSGTLSFRKIKLLETAKYYLVETRKQY